MMSILNRIKTVGDVNVSEVCWSSLLSLCNNPLYLRVQVLGLILWIVCWTDLFSSFHEMSQNQSKPPIYFVTPLIVGMTMVSVNMLVVSRSLKSKKDFHSTMACSHNLHSCLKSDQREHEAHDLFCRLLILSCFGRLLFFSQVI